MGSDRRGDRDASGCPPWLELLRTETRWPLVGRVARGRLSARLFGTGPLGRLLLHRAIEGVGEGDRVDVVEIAVRKDLGIDEERDRHVGALMRRQGLLVEAEARDLVEILPDLERRHVEDGHAARALAALVLGHVVREALLADLDRDLTLDRREEP